MIFSNKTDLDVADFRNMQRNFNRNNLNGLQKITVFLAGVVDKGQSNGLLPTTRTGKNKLPVLRGINRASSGLFSASAKLH